VRRAERSHTPGEKLTLAAGSDQQNRSFLRSAFAIAANQGEVSSRQRGAIEPLQRLALQIPRVEGDALGEKLTGDFVQAIQFRTRPPNHVP
jgi:hypothetical protein